MWPPIESHLWPSNIHMWCKINVSLFITPIFSISLSYMCTLCYLNSLITGASGVPDNQGACVSVQWRRLRIRLCVHVWKYFFIQVRVIVSPPHHFQMLNPHYHLLNEPDRSHQCCPALKTSVHLLERLYNPKESVNEIYSPSMPDLSYQKMVFSDHWVGSKQSYIPWIFYNI